MNGIITLITDFGAVDWYVGAMKGVILGVNPDARIIDITHEVKRGDVWGAALVLKNTFPFCPEGTVHVVVVDPGVGTEREIILVQAKGSYLLLPDNGIVDVAMESGDVKKVRAVRNKEYWMADVSSTFHGRDIFSPVAAKLSLGAPPEAFGPSYSLVKKLEVPDPEFKSDRTLEAEVIYVDSFGNLITNLTMGHRFAGREAVPLLKIGDRTIRGFRRTYGDASAGELVALYGSSGRLEISVSGGSAAGELGAGRGTKLIITW